MESIFATSAFYAQILNLGNPQRRNPGLGLDQTLQIGSNFTAWTDQADIMYNIWGKKEEMITSEPLSFEKA